MKKSLLFFILSCFIIVTSYILVSAVDFGFGPAGLIKKKVEKLDDKVIEKRGGTKEQQIQGLIDSTPPVISNVSSSDVGISSMSIVWSTDEAATSYVEYGTSTVYGTQTQLDSALVLTHQVNIENLHPHTTYHFRITSADSSGNTAATTTGSYAFMSASVIFTRLPFDIENVGGIMTIGNFVFTHTRSNPQINRPYGMERHAMYHKSPGTAYNAYCPATTYIVSVRKSQGIGDYGFNFKLERDIYFRHDHVHAVDSALEAQVAAQLGGSWDETSPFIALSTPIFITAGTLLGQTGFKQGSANWDWYVGEGSDPDEGITYPDHYVTSMGGLYKSAKSCYDYSTDEVKQQLESLAGYWDGSQLQERTGTPPLGKCGHDIDGALSGIWFYDYSDDATWGPKLAAFIPYYLDTSSATVKLAIPELDLYGVWNTTYTNVTDRINLHPKDVTSNDGIVYYILNVHDNNENGLLMVQLNSNNTITLETHKDVYDPAAYTVFTSSAITLSR